MALLTLEEMDRMLPDGRFHSIKNRKGNNKINEELISKEEDKTENKPQQIKIRFIKKINP